MRAKPHQLVVVEPLPAKPQDEVIGPGSLDRIDGSRRQLLGQVHTVYVSAQRRP